MPQHDHRGGQANELGGGDIVLVLLDHDGAAHRAGVLHPKTQPDREHQDGQHAHLVELVAKDRFGDAVDQERDQDGRERELHVGDAHDQPVDGAAEIAGRQPEHDAERAG